MEAFWKAAAVIILTIILGVSLGRKEKDISVVLSVVGCCMVLMVAVSYLSEVISFLWKIGNSTSFQNPFLGTLMQISGVALVTELTSLISSDAGNSALGKAMQLLGNAVILFLSLPLFDGFFTIIQEFLDLL